MPAWSPFFSFLSVLDVVLNTFAAFKQYHLRFVSHFQVLFCEISVGNRTWYTCLSRVFGLFLPSDTARRISAGIEHLSNF